MFDVHRKCNERYGNISHQQIPVAKHVNYFEGQSSFRIKAYITVALTFLTHTRKTTNGEKTRIEAQIFKKNALTSPVYPLSVTRMLLLCGLLPAC